MSKVAIQSNYDKSSAVVKAGWREVVLNDIAILVKKSWKVGDAPLPYIGLEHIDEGKLKLNGFGNSDDIISNKYRFFKGNVLFGKLRPYFRKVVLPKFDGVCSTDIWVLKPRDEIDNVFLFYFFANQKFIELAYSGSSGTRMPRADWDFIKNTKWIVPKKISEQKVIAKVLSSFDGKIDLLQRQNKTLEEMGQVLFRKWFVEEADEEWKEKPLDEIADYLNGLAC